MKKELQKHSWNGFNSLKKKCFFIFSFFLLTASYSFAQTVSSLSELKTYLDDDDVNVTMTPGIYTITAAETTATDVVIGGQEIKVLFYVSGNNSTYDFTGVTINIETAVLRAYGNYDIYEINISGNNNVLKNLTMVDDGSVDDNPTYGTTNIVMDGSGNRLEGFDMTVRGSTPYGYGDAFGKGGGPIITHRKHSALLVRGESNHVKNCTILHQSYGHAIFMQAARDPLVEGCYIEGEVRTTDDMLAEEGTGSEADNVNFQTVWGYRLPAGFMMSLGEEGVRAYNGGITVIDGVESSYGTINPTIRDCTIKFMRFGVNMGHAQGPSIATGCTTIGCELGVSADDISGSTVDVSYGPAGLGGYNITRDVTITKLLETYNGSGRVGYIFGTGNDITLRTDEKVVDQSLQLVVSGGYNSIGFQEGTLFDYQNDYSGSNNTISNLTPYPIVLGENSSNNTGVSGGMIIDLGTNNNITHIALSVFDIEAEDYTTMSGVTTEETTDEGAGENVNSIDVDDWMEYEVSIPYDGTYSLDYRVASASESGDLSLSIGDTELEQLTFPSTGGAQVWTTVRSTTPIFLEEGVQTLKITSNSSGWNLNWVQLLGECFNTPIIPNVEITNSIGFEFSNEETNEATVFPGLTVTLAPELILGGGWSWTGPNSYVSSEREISISDVQTSDAGNYVVTYTNECGQQTKESFVVNVAESLVFEAENYDQMSGVLTETTTDVGGGDNVYEINNGDWIEFDINIPFSANFYIDYRVASAATGGSFTLSSDGLDIDDVSFDATGGAQTWETISSSSLINLSAGEHTIRVSSSMDEWSMNWLELKVDQAVSTCELPFAHEDIISISNQTYNWSTGAISITCSDSVSVFANIGKTGTLDDDDYLNIYYKLDGGDLTPITENTGLSGDEFVYVEDLTGDVIEIVIEGYTSSANKAFTVSNLLMQYGSIFLSDKIEAEDYDEIITGTAIVVEGCTDEGGGSQLGYLSNGDWCMFEDLDLTNVISVTARVASRQSGTIEVRLDSPNGTLISSIAMPATGGWAVYDSFSADVVSTVGLHDVYFVLPVEFNINWFQFSIDGTAKLSQEIIMLEEEEKTLGDEDYIPFTFVSSDLPVTYSSSNLEVAIIVDGKISLVGVGTTIITARSEGSSIYEPAERTQILTVVAAPELSFENVSKTVEIYPNPTNGILHLKMENNLYARLEIYNITGTRILNRSINVNDNSLDLDLENLSKGVYVVVLKGSQKMETHKVVKY